MNLDYPQCKLPGASNRPAGERKFSGEILEAGGGGWGESCAQQKFISKGSARQFRTLEHHHAKSCTYHLHLIAFVLLHHNG